MSKFKISISEISSWTILSYQVLKNYISVRKSTSMTMQMLLMSKNCWRKSGHSPPKIARMSSLPITTTFSSTCLTINLPSVANSSIDLSNCQTFLIKLLIWNTSFWLIDRLTGMILEIVFKQSGDCLLKKQEKDPMEEIVANLIFHHKSKTWMINNKTLRTRTR